MKHGKRLEALETTTHDTLMNKVVDALAALVRWTNDNGTDEQRATIAQAFAGQDFDLLVGTLETTAAPDVLQSALNGAARAFGAFIRALDSQRRE